MFKRQCVSLMIGSVMLTAGAASAAVPNSTLGYWAHPFPVLFPDTSPAFVFGSTLQQTTAESNPDVWCQDQANGYRTPYASDMNELHVSVVPPYAPANGKIGTAERKASLSLYNEWGNVKQYPGSGWDEAEAIKSFWVAEPASNSERYGYEITTGAVVAKAASSSNHVVCVAAI